MNNKGYTLIELIAVIVILLIAGIITLPIVLTNINKVRYENAKANAYEIIASVKLYHYNKLISNNGIFNETTFNCDNKCKYLSDELEIANNPSSGSVTISNDGTITGSLSFFEGDYTFYICNNVLSDEKITNCSSSNVLTLKKDDYKSGTEIIYAGLIWNVLKDNGDDTLLVLKNTIGTGSLGNKKYDYPESDVNKKLNEWFDNNQSLKTAKEQEKLVLMKFNVSDKDYENYVRIPSKIDVGVTKTTDKCNTSWCNINKTYWLYNYLLSGEGIYKTYNIGEDGLTYGDDMSNELGIRPIIDVKEQ